MDVWTETNLSDIDADDIYIPEWINQDIDSSQVAAIVQGGCASGAYMPAVTYWQALETMGRHGDEIFDYLDGADMLWHLWQGLDGDVSWGGLACHIVSKAVELWASEMINILKDYEPEGD